MVRRIRHAETVLMRRRKNIASRALAIAVKNRRRLASAEWKFIEFKETQQDMIQAGIKHELTNIANGNNASSRVGNKIRLVMYEFSAFIQTNVLVNATFIRIQLIKDKNTNGAIFTTADLLTNTAAGDNIASTYNEANLKRFTVLINKI